MAVKQHSTETSQQRPDLKYNITKIIEYITGIEQNIEHDIDNKINLPQVCKQIIDLLGNAHPPSNAFVIKKDEEQQPENIV